MLLKSVPYPSWIVVKTGSFLRRRQTTPLVPEGRLDVGVVLQEETTKFLAAVRISESFGPKHPSADRPRIILL